MSESAPSRTKIIAAYAAIYLIWGSTYLGIRFAIETIPPFLMGGTRFMIAGAILYVLMRARGEPRPTLAQVRSTAIIGAAFILCGNGTVVWAEQFVPSGIVALLVAILPFWIVLIEWLGPARIIPGFGVTLGLIAGIAGIVVLIGADALNPSTSAGGALLKGALAVMGSSLVWAIGSIYSRKAALPRSAFTATGLEMFLGGAMMFMVSLITREPMHFDPAGVSARSIAGFIYLTTIGSLVGFTAFIWLLQHEPPARVSTYAYVNPVVAVFLGWALAGEPLTPRTVIAAAIIIGAVALITTARSSSRLRAQE
ncbi:MAG TPA: EamA family transporter [Gemmatimonadaceae bacterium]